MLLFFQLVDFSSCGIGMITWFGGYVMYVWDRWDEECKCAGRSSWNLFLSSWNHGYMACYIPSLLKSCIYQRYRIKMHREEVKKFPDSAHAFVSYHTVTTESTDPHNQHLPGPANRHLLLQLPLNRRHNAPGMFTAPKLHVPNPYSPLASIPLQPPPVKSTHPATSPAPTPRL